MITLSIIIFISVLGLSLSAFDIYSRYLAPLKERIKNLYEENDALLDANYKLARKIDRQNKLIGSQEKIISDLAEEVKQYRNSFNNN